MFTTILTVSFTIKRNFLISVFFFFLHGTNGTQSGKRVLSYTNACACAFSDILIEAALPTNKSTFHIKESSTNRDRIYHCARTDGLIPYSIVTLFRVEHQIDRIKRKSAFVHAQNVQIQITLSMRNVLSVSLLSIRTFCSIQWFYLKTVKALIRLCGCAAWSEPSLSVYPRRQVYAWHGLSVITGKYILCRCYYG